ncbi:hypothetical protein KAH37_01480 [bacterium]|nr:hypothetical protein [bacterium]
MLRLITVLLFFFCITLTADYISIHQSERERHQKESPLLLYKSPSVIPRADGATVYTPIVSSKVFGYLPYWANGTDNIKYSLLTDILYFSCELASSGALGDCHSWPDAAPIEEAHRYGVKMHLTVTSFDKATVVNLITSPSFTTTFYQNIYNKVHDAGADGVNLDFEFSSGDDSDEFASFVNGLADYFHSRDSNLVVSVAIPAVDWQGTFDLAQMDKADYFFIMAYDYHWKGGEPGPVAPLYSESPWATGGICVQKSVTTYSGDVGDDHKEKLIAGFPYYGYRWPTTNDTIPGVKTANATAVVYRSIEADYTSHTTGWDDGSKTPYKIYNESGWKQLWFDDDDSLGLKYAFLQESGVGGTGMWALNSDGIYDGLWQQLAENFSERRKGSAENPVVVETFPFGDTHNTYHWLSDQFDRYTCDKYDNAQDINEEGPEVIYKISLECPGVLHVALSDGQGGSSSREDVDIHLLRSLDANDCIIRGDIELHEELEQGDYYLVVDSFVDGDGVRKGGAYTILFDFISDCEENPDSDTGEDDDNESVDVDSITTEDETGDDDIVADNDSDMNTSTDLDVDESTVDGDEKSDETAVSSGDGCGCLLI